MLANTFIHLPGIGPEKERALWSAGVWTWDEFEQRFFAQKNLFENGGESAIELALKESRYALAKGEFDYFAERLPKSEHGAVAGLVGIEVGVVSGVLNLESSGVRAPDWRPRHDNQYHEVRFLAACGGDGC